VREGDAPFPAGRVAFLEPAWTDAHVPAITTERTHGVYECSFPLSGAPLGSSAHLDPYARLSGGLFRISGIFKRKAMKTERQSRDPANIVLWQSSSSPEITARIAITGDFAPSHDRAISSGDDWRERARPLTPLFRDVDATSPISNVR